MNNRIRCITSGGFACVVALWLTSAVGGEELRPMIASPHVADFSGEGRIHCYCIAGTSGCSREFFWRVAGLPTNDWWQDVNLVSGKAADLTAACFRKREVKGLGNGLCCSVDEKDGKPDDEMMRKFFGVSEVRKK